MQTPTIKKTDNENPAWQNTLGFYKDELDIFKKRLAEVAAKNTAKEILQMVEHFQNQFLIQTENIDILHHDIDEYRNAVAKEIQQHAGHVNAVQLATHDVLKSRFENEEKVFTDFKKEFAVFLSKVM